MAQINTEKLILYEVNGRRIISKRPKRVILLNIRTQSRLAALFLETKASAKTLRFLTDELGFGTEGWVEISPEVWEDVVPSIKVLKVERCAAPPPPIVPERNLEVPNHTKVEDAEKAAVTPSGNKAEYRLVTLEFVYTGLRQTYTARPQTKIYNLLSQFLPTIGHTIQTIDHFRCNYKGRLISLQSTIQEEDVEDGDSISVLLTLRGGKPVIYLRSPRDIEATVDLSLAKSWSLSAIYPVVPSKDPDQKVSWKVMTKKNGEMKEVTTGLDISYLFWEAHTNSPSRNSPPVSPLLSPVDSARKETFDPAAATLSPSNSVLLPTNILTPYLDKVLNALTLHTEARNSFITYWLPKFLNHRYIALRFLPQDAYERAAPLSVSPLPDVTTRVFMLFRGVNEADLSTWEEVKDRAGVDVDWWVDVVGVDAPRARNEELFSVLEWGGMEVCNH